VARDDDDMANAAGFEKGQRAPDQRGALSFDEAFRAVAEIIAKAHAPAGSQDHRR
jgi:hypothetical protein